MADQRPAPGRDEIVVSVPAGRYPCNTRAHANLGCPAEVIVTFGELGTRWRRDALWQDAWGRSFAMCAACWDSTRQIARSHRPGLTVTEASQPAQLADGSGRSRPLPRGGAPGAH